MSGPIIIGVEDGRLMIRISDTTIYHPLKDWNGTVIPAHSIRGDTECLPLIIDFDQHARVMGFIDAKHFEALVNFLRELAKETALKTGGEFPDDLDFYVKTKLLEVKRYVIDADVEIKRALWAKMNQFERVKLRNIFGYKFEQQYLLYDEGNYPHV